MVYPVGMRAASALRSLPRIDKPAFTLVELLVVMAIMSLLAALLLPALSKAKASARRTHCLSNLKQVSMAVLMYADDHHQNLPGRSGSESMVSGWHAYKSLVKPYVGLTGTSPSRDVLFVCPADRFHYDAKDKRVPHGMHEEAWSDFSSYAFNNANLIKKRAGWKYPNALLGVGQTQDTAVREPARTVLVADTAAWPCYSWHAPKRLPGGDYRFNNAWNMASFVDGHVQYTRFYFDKTGVKGAESWHYDPPAGYEYQWSAGGAN